MKIYIKDGKAIKINNQFITKKTDTPSTHKIRIVRSYDGNATSYCRMIVDGTTTNDTKEIEYDAGTAISWFVMSIGAMAAQAKIILNGVTVQAGPGSYSMTLNSDLLVQFARGGSGTKLYYEIYITEVPSTIKEVWLLNETIQIGEYGAQFFYPFYSYDQKYTVLFGKDQDVMLYSPSYDDPNLDVNVYNVDDSGTWVSQGYRLVGLTESYLMDYLPEWWIQNAVPYFYKGDTYVLNENMRKADLINVNAAFRSNDTDFTKLRVVDDI